MAIRLFLALTILVGLMWYLAWYRGATPQQRNHSLRIALFYCISFVLLVLVLTGRIPWLFALISAVIPWINRALIIKRLWNQFTGTEQHNTYQQQSNNNRKNTQEMSVEDAYEILGLQPSATKQEIIDAHRKLMQKYHPDRGGSDYLASQLNQAKDVLMRSKKD